MASPASLLLRRSIPLIHSSLPHIVAPYRRFTACLSTLEASQRSDSAPAGASCGTAKPLSPPNPPNPPPPPQSERLEWEVNSWADHPDYRRWKDKEEEILKDIEPITLLTKEILHSDRYMDGERLCPDDEKEVVQKLLGYHPHSEDKIGCGLDYLMVDRHPTFRNSRCLFVVRTDGHWIDFSYQKCLRAYIREKYPSYGERFIRGHFKRT